VKAVEEMYAPISGTVVEINQALADNPETVNADPYGEGWLVKVRINNEDELEDAMSADEYRELVAGES